MGRPGRPRVYEIDSTEDERRIAKNARRCLARTADPTYNARHLNYQRAYVAKNLECERIRKRAWKHANPHHKKVTRQARRARENRAPGRHSAAQIQTLLMLQGGQCAYCDVSDDLHLDHAIPLSRGGSNWPWNLQWLCAWHNIAKGNKTDAEYRAEIGLPPAVWAGARLWTAALLLPMWVLA